MEERKMQPSQIIKMFLDFLDGARGEYNYNLEAMKNEERMTQDYLHLLELGDVGCRERGKIATKLVANRKNRRKYKDAVEELEPIIDFIDDAQNRNVLNKMTQLLGQVRKVENYHKTRIYVPKMLDIEPIVDEKGEANACAS